MGIFFSKILKFSLIVYNPTTQTDAPIRLAKRDATSPENENSDTKSKGLRVERYRLYPQEWEKEFVAVDQLRDKMRDNDPDYVETQIVKAVAEVKTKEIFQTVSEKRRKTK